MRETRRDLKRTYHTPLVFVLLAFLATAIGIVGNVYMSPSNVHYFFSYFLPAIIFVFITIYYDFFLKLLLRLTKNMPTIHSFLQKHFAKVTNGDYIVFVHHLERLYSIFSYLDRNEIGRNVYLVFCNDNNTKESHKHAERFTEAKKMLPVLQKAGVYPYFHVTTLFKNKPFGPKLVEEVSKELHVDKNRILIGSIHHEHPFEYDDLGGVRIIF